MNRGIDDENDELIDIVAGPCFICDCSGENFDSLDDERIEKYLKLFNYPEVFIRIDGKMMSIKLN